VLNTRENKKRPKILVLLSFLRINYCAGWMWRIWQRAYSTRMQRRTLTSSAANARKYVSIVFFLPEAIFTEEIPGTSPHCFPSKPLLHIISLFCYCIVHDWQNYRPMFMFRVHGTSRNISELPTQLKIYCLWRITAAWALDFPLYVPHNHRQLIAKRTIDLFRLINRNIHLHVENVASFILT